MRIHSVRLGHACNSSSSHSLIFLDGARDSGGCGDDFGWDDFTLASPERKRAYFAHMLYLNLEETVGPEIARTVAAEWAGYEFGDGDYREVDGYIDHQSVLCLPMDWGGKGIDREFAMAYRDHMLRDGVVVLGGNDNSDGHPLSGSGPDASGGLPTEDSSRPWRCRKDAGGFWTLFNRVTGAKIRVDFRDAAARPTKASAPELVDVKITDFCPLGCSWCYMDSHGEGKHAKQQTLESVAYALGELKVFECAIGGGEPTLHPHFGDFLRVLRQWGVVANFTTRRLEWLHDHKLAGAYLGDHGAFAYSVQSERDVHALAEALAAARVSASKATAQHVLGTQPRWQVEQIAKAAAQHGISLTLLGYKPTGRGKDFKPEPYDWWPQVVKEHCRQVRIDTCLAKDAEALLKAEGVSPWMYEVREGAFSMFIDAVTLTMAQSSYSGDPRPWRDDGQKDYHKAARVRADEIRAAFAEMVPV